MPTPINQITVSHLTNPDLQQEIVYIIIVCKGQYLVKMLRLLGGQLQLLTRGKERKKERGGDAAALKAVQSDLCDICVTIMAICLDLVPHLLNKYTNMHTYSKHAPTKK